MAKRKRTVKAGRVPKAGRAKRARSTPGRHKKGKAVRIKKKSFAVKRMSRFARTGMGGTSGDVEYMTRKLGHKAKKSMTDVYKRINAALEPAYYRWQRLIGYEVAAGALALARGVVGVPPAAGSEEAMPMFMFNLSAVDRMRTGLAPGIQCAYQLKKVWPATGVVSPQYSFNFVTGNAPDGTVSQLPWLRENSSSTNPQCIRDILEWVDIRMDCIGATTIPTKWEISIVQFKDVTFEPEYQLANSTLDIDVMHRERQRALLYDAWINPWISHPILLQNPKLNATVIKQNVKVLFKQSFITQAKESTDLYTSGQEKIIKIFKWFNKTQVYEWDEANRPPNPQVGGVETMGYAQNNPPAIQNDVEPKQRLYLVVKAQCHTVNSATATVCPSFDIVMRKKHMEDVA